MKKSGYWAATGLVALCMLSGGAAAIAHQKDTLAGFTYLGYPAYFVTILGWWKVLGAIAILAPGFARLKEWAYAGIFFDLTGAAASHAAMGSAAFHVTVPLALAGITIVSWAWRPENRVIGVLFEERGVADGRARMAGGTI